MTPCTKQIDAAYNAEMARTIDLLKTIPLAIQEHMVAPDEAAAADAMIGWDNVASLKQINGLLSEILSLVNGSTRR